MTNVAKVALSIQASPAVVWEALTRPELIKKYFFGTTTITTWEVGSPIRFVGEWEGQAYEDKGTVLAFELCRLIRYDYWSSMSGTEDVPENYIEITYTLEEEEGGTLLRIEQGPMKDEETAAHSEGNWLSVMVGLKELVEAGI